MTAALPQAASAPTMYFVGVTTGGSAIHAVFRAWKPLLGLESAELVGIDLPLDADREDYRRVVRFIGHDPFSRGALVTTHKLRLFEASRDLLVRLNDDARELAEVSCLVSEQDGVAGLALDAVTSGLALRAITPDLAGRHVLLMGAGGAALALASSLASLPREEAPAHVTVTDVVARNLESLASHVRGRGADDWDYVLLERDQPQDELLAALPAGSLVVNATGKGKDRPGSPLSDDAVFPEGALCWEFNYRGSLEFLHQARAQADARDLQVHDGWIYFVHGWTRAIAEVFDVDIPTEGPVFDRIAEAAREVR